MKRMMMLASLSVLGTTMASGAAHAAFTEFMIPGSVCQPTNASRNSIEYNQFGAVNISGTVQTVVCPLPFSSSGTLGSTIVNASANVYDRNTAADIVCTLHVTGFNGNDAITPIVANSSGGGPGSAAQSFGFTINSQFDRMLTMVCTLPAAQSGSFSSITSMFLFVNPA